MKTQLIIWFLCTFMVSALMGQNQLSVGVVGSPSVVFLRDDRIDSRIVPKIAYSCGIKLQFNLNEILSLSTDIQYEKKGLQTKDILEVTDDNGLIDRRISKYYNCLDYITIPLILRVNFGKKTKIFLSSGIFMGYLLQQKSLYYSKDYLNKQNQTKDYKKWDWGVSMGVGVSYPLSQKLFLTAEIRNNLGLYNTYNIKFANSAIFTNSTNILLGASLKIGKKE